MPEPRSETFCYTIFPNVFAREQIQRLDRTLDEFAAPILAGAPIYPSKAACPLFSGVLFGDVPNNKNCLRYGENAREVWGVVGDLDRGTLSFEQVMAVLQAGSIASLIYTTGSHSAECPRLRIIAPTSESYSPDRYEELVGRLNRIVGGVLSRESFPVAQSFFVGRVAGVAYQAMRIQGRRCIDQAIDIEPLPFVEPGKQKTNGAGRDHLAEWIAGIESGEHIHTTTVALAAHLAAMGTARADAETLMRGHLETKRELWYADAKLRARFELTWRELPRILDSGYAKFARPRFTSDDTAASADAFHRPVEWPEPIDPSSRAIPVMPFEADFLPPRLRAWVFDVAERMNCPVDYPAIAALVVLGAAVGRRCGIRPKQLDSWIVVPNLWGALIGPPGVMKSPPLEQIVRPLQAMDWQSIAEHGKWFEQHKIECARVKELQKAWGARVRKGVDAGEPPAMPEGKACTRYITSDPTVEKLGEILRDNPAGVLLFRDELTGFLMMLERVGREGDRQFFLEAWRGTGGFTVDRIGRGTIAIRAACVSLLGSLTPQGLREYLGACAHVGTDDDGMLSRFQLAVWPDLPASAVVDRRPDLLAESAAHELLHRLAAAAAPAELAGLHFTDEAQPIFNAWLLALETRLRSGELLGPLQAHLAKYRSLVPSLALLLHLSETTAFASVGTESLERAIRLAAYLETHARRVYGAHPDAITRASMVLAKHLEAGELGSEFSLRELYRRHWSGLADREAARDACAELEEHGWLAKEIRQTGGRAAVFYRVNPKVRHAQAHA